MMEEFRLERLSDERIEDVRMLFREVFGKKVKASYLHQKYDTSYLGEKHLCYLAYHAERPVAFYGAIPFPFRYKDQSFLAAHACDSITLPDFQKRGLHRMLALKTYELMREKGLKFIFAMHSDATHKATRKLNWIDQERMRRFHLSLAGPGLGRFAKRAPGGEAWMEKRAGKILKDHLIPDNALQNPLIEEGFIAVDYSTGFLGSKTFSKKFAIEIEGQKFWIKTGSKILVGFSEISDREAFQAGLLQLRKLAARMGAKEIMFQVSRGSHQEKILAELFPGEESWLIGYLPFDESLPFEKLKLNFADLDTF